MKKIILLLVLALSASLLHAQTFTTDSGSTAKVFGWDYVSIPNYITNTTSSSFKITWHVVSTDYLSSWGGYYGVCDNNVAYTSPGVGTNYTSDYYAPGVMGDFHAYFSLTNAPLGTHYVTVSLTGASYTKTLTFIVDKEIHVDSIHSFTGHTLCDTTTLTLPLASTGSNVTYNWQYSKDSISWYTVSTTNKYHITDPRDHGYYRAILGATGYSVTDTSKVYKLNAPPAATISIAAIPGTSITSGTLVNFVATVANVGPTPAFQWSKNGIDIPSATVNSYVSNTLSNNDVIECRVNGVTYCNTPDSGKSNKLVMSVTTGVQTLNPAKQDFAVYPNPNNGTFKLLSTASIKNATIQIVNAIGQTVYTEVADINGSRELHLGGLQDGLYILHISSTDYRYTQQFVIQK